jgi:hypothetical protein
MLTADHNPRDPLFVHQSWVDILSSADESVADPTVAMIRSETFIAHGLRHTATGALEPFTRLTFDRP